MTRQWEWQLKKFKQGLCTICGKRKLYKGRRCRKHYDPNPPWRVRWGKEHPELLKESRIRYLKKNPCYFKRWYLKHREEIRRHYFQKKKAVLRGVR